ncbi:MAG: molybdenum cofactor biosynthesis protein MoaE [Sphingomonadaceae bacterium]|jgi:molybdopterin synthase catalytic subunit|uniref:molybdenum cofactor biosynthesis protein MoaE n=1 Tax=Sphingorhabdus sp. TaxID=1902408 RepID=UPI002FDA915C|nr:molybdenum cofactor biosynthesis protein MoaE [Sphingomonadaceae bacterium]
MKIVRISNAAIQPDQELAALTGLGGGALASFTGIVRDDGGVTAIELEHYPSMTEASLYRLIEAATARWTLLGAVITHRVGIIPVGAPVVVVGTSSLHRAEALEATAFLIDRLKTEAPFWKREHYADGSAKWVEAKASDEARAERWV